MARLAEGSNGRDLSAADASRVGCSRRRAC